MVRHYKKKVGGRNYKTGYAKNDFSNALKAIQSGSMSIRKVAKEYHVLYTSLQNKIKGNHPNKIGGQKRLSDELEIQIVEVSDELTEWKVPLDGVDIRHLVKNYLDAQDVKDSVFTELIGSMDSCKGII